MSEASSLSLVESFTRYFSVEIARTAEQKALVYGVRFRVYCEEFNYEAVDKFPQRLETDEYDEFSRHCLIMHRASGRPAGCVRLVPATLVSGARLLLPLEKHCGPSLDVERLQALNLKREQQCEISRLAVDTAFRRRTGESLTRFGEINGLHFSTQERRTFSLIAVACFLAATAMTKMDDRTQVFAMMEPFLPRMMQRSGIVFQRIGRDMDYHGIRAPYFITTQSALDSMQLELKELYEWIQQALIT